MAVLDQYKQIQENILANKSATPIQNPVWGNITWLPTPTITNVPAQPNMSVAPAPQPPVQPAPAPQVAGTTTQVPETPQTTPQATVEKDILSPNVTGVNPNQDKLEQANLNKLNSNLSLYSTWKSLYDAVQGGSLLPWTKEFTDLATRNPQVLQEYNLIKADKDKTNTVKALGNAIVGEPVQTPPSNALEQLVSFFTKSMDTDVAGEYQNSVINNPAYQASIQQMNGINQQIADNNNNINALRNDVRKKYSAWARESLIASAIAREARPLIEQGQYLTQLQQNAQAEMTRLFEENKAVFDLRQEERNTKNQRMIDLYGTIRNEEIRQEDFARADQKLADEIARTDKADAAKIAQLEQERLDNVKEAIAKLGVAPVGATYDELLGEYATAVKNQPTDIKPFTVGKDSYVFDPATGKYILPPWATSTGTAPAPSRKPTIQSWFTQEGTFKVDIPNGATPRKSSRGYYECAMLVNDVIGTAMPDLHTDKLKYVNSNTPVVWGAFVEKTNDKYGHTGIVESINADGTINIVETNYPVGSGVTRKTIDPSKRNIVGYYDPQTASQEIELTMSDVSTFNNSTYKPQSEADPAMKKKYEQFLKTKNWIMKQKEADINEVMSYSQWGKDLTDTDTKSLTKFSQALDQIGGIQKQIKDIKTWPVLWKLKQLNPYDTDAQVLTASLNALIPNLARGVYWEVGVLTDNDIRQYARTIPNLTQTNDVNNAVLALTLDTVAWGYKRQLQTLAAAGKDVSGFAGIYDSLKAQSDWIKSNIPWFSSTTPSAEKKNIFKQTQTQTSTVNPDSIWQ